MVTRLPGWGPMLLTVVLVSSSSADRSSRGVHLHDPHTLRSHSEFTIALQGADAAAREATRLLQTFWDKGDALTRRTAAN